MKVGLSLGVSQHLALTPQLQQSIRLLQLSTLELAQEVEAMLIDNPFLERAGEEPPAAGAPAPERRPERSEIAPISEAFDADPESAGSQNSAETRSDWEGDRELDPSGADSPWSSEAPGRAARREDDESEASEHESAHETLAEHLHRQALLLRLTRAERAALSWLIDSLNDDGYLEDAIESLVETLVGPENTEYLLEMSEHFALALKLLQSLEPAGVGARSLAECLQLQLAALRDAGACPRAVLDAAMCICEQPLEWLARRDVRRLSQACGASEEDTRAAMALIARLEPRPGRRFAQVQHNLVTPDVLVRRRLEGGQVRLDVQLNPEVVPQLRVHDAYAQALRQHRKDEGHAALQSRLQEARWFIRNVEQRFDTILRTARAIVDKQQPFFLHGELAMRPLVMREIAEELGLHESTISRVTSAKYMATPQGTYELKYFFGSGLGTDTGGSTSSTAVRALLRQFIAAEDPARPLSDGQLADMLKEQGIACARRTVAKYREQLKIAPASLRRQV
ncbi:RNA polymerase factor sigma-54 [Comamonas sp. NLF-1-9]|uniref:RNA polymerase factor sigma-54 n=1 Tax=Comamonas sp. NLF-1-9 TaxID=2853163 RepID=UPI001C44AA9C|nr:RNA polymerase factor sigma-54 [Comamonas sp. NLF-1-9]QXL83845.1 RNA polymerase factor sigma-54 [Comamonas sp. NLF-1-9]